MNRERLLLVADAIEQSSIPRLGFNMCDYVARDAIDRSGHRCGTTACIGGWTLALFEPENYRTVEELYLLFREKYWSSAPRLAGYYLDLSECQKSELFLGKPSSVKGLTDVTPQQAVNVLRYAAEHGVIDWNAANEDINNRSVES